MAKIKFYLDLRSVRADGASPLKINISHRRKTALVSTGVFLLPSQWDDGSRCVMLHPRRAAISNHLNHLYCDVEEVVLGLTRSGELDALTVTEVKQRVLARLRPCFDAQEDDVLFAQWFERFALSRPKPRTREIYASTLSRLRAFCPTLARLRFEDVDHAWLGCFDKWLAQFAPSRNARNIHLRNIRAVFNDAIDEEATTFYPFRKFKIKGTPTPKRSLSVEQLRLLFSQPVSPSQQKYLDAFRLIFMLIGINVVDLVHLKEVVAGRVEYYRAKTQRLYSVKVEPEAMEIIERYRGSGWLLGVLDRYVDYRDYSKRLNMNLHEIGAACGVPQLTTYWARHSWATIAASLDIPKETIAAALGHGGRSVTDIYIDFDQRKVDAANRRVLDWVLYGNQ